MPGVREALGRLRGVRYIEWVLLAVAAAAAVLLLSGKETGGGAARTDLEARMESVLSCVAGAGQVRVLVGDGAASPVFGQADDAAGVVVVAEGAEDLRVALELERAVRALLGVEAGQIEILDMREEAS